MAPPPRLPLRLLERGTTRLELDASRAAPDAAVPAAPPRRLTLTFRRLDRGLPAILVAATAPLASCYLSHPREDTDASIARDGGLDATAPDAASPDAASPDTPWPDADLACMGAPYDTFVVDLPPEGVPAEPALLCDAPGSPVESALAARVTLEPTTDPMLASGTITLADGLDALVLDVPRVAELDGMFGAVAIEALRREGAVYRFDARFGTPIFPSWGVGPWSRLRFEVRFTIDCAPGAPREIAASTFVVPCDGFSGGPTFASSGEECRTCAIIAEMAPTPILPTERPDALPLQRGLALVVRPIARFGNAVVLRAEHDQAGVRASYEWRARRGRIHVLEQDLVVWEAADPSTASLVQVAAQAAAAAAVASFRTGAAW
ncbi:MAG: hypothetical protein K1X94_12365 [Sandaracinaceae bacterium]|nr:hypothetical protein [Sandaracinaceae bacterium]